jgi:hypothetical protein
VLWSPASGRNGRSREFLVQHLATRTGLLEAAARNYDRQHDPLRSKAQRRKYWGKSTTPAEPLSPLIAESVETVESWEFVAPQGPAREVNDSAVLVTARRSGNDNTTLETVVQVPSVTVPATPHPHRTWSDLISDALAHFESQPTRNARAVAVGLGRCLDHLTIEQGSEAARAVFDLAVGLGETTTIGFTTALRSELKDALDLDGHDGEEEFADICADRSILRTDPQITWASATDCHHNLKETGT